MIAKQSPPGSHAASTREEPAPGRAAADRRWEAGCGATARAAAHPWAFRVLTCAVAGRMMGWWTGRENKVKSGEETGVVIRSSTLLPFSALQGRRLLSTFYWQRVPSPERPDWLA